MILLSHILIAFGAFQALFIAAIFLLQKKRNLPKLCFSIFLIVEGITLIERVLVETDLIQYAPHLLGISYPLSFIKAPTLFLMGLAIVNPKFKLRRIHLLHFIPLLVALLFNIPFYGQSGEFKLSFVKDFMAFVPTYNTFEFYLYCTFFLHIGTYLLLTIQKLRNYQLQIKNNRLTNFYIKVLRLYSIFLLISLIYFLVRPLAVLEVPFFNTISMLLMTFLIQSIAYRFFSQSNMFHGTVNPMLINSDRLQKHEDLVRDKMEQEKLFLDDALKLEDLAKSSGLSKKYLSDLINQRFGKSFTDWVNQYRVQEAQRLMKAHSQIQLKEIAYESGFNNKVSFYRTFKRHTGRAPSDYLQEIKRTSGIAQ